MMRQAVGVGLERGVAQRAVLKQHRDRLRRAPSLRRKQRRQRHRRRSSPSSGRLRQHRPRSRRTASAAGERQRMRGVVPAAQDGVALGFAQDRKPAERTAAVRHHSPQQPHQPLAKPRSRRRVEQVAGIFHDAVDAGRLTVGRAPLDQPKRQVELRARGRHRLRPHRKPRQIEPAADAAPPRTPASPGTAGAATATAPD